MLLVQQCKLYAVILPACSSKGYCLSCLGSSSSNLLCQIKEFLLKQKSRGILFWQSKWWRIICKVFLKNWPVSFTEVLCGEVCHWKNPEFGALRRKCKSNHSWDLLPPLSADLLSALLCHGHCVHYNRAAVWHVTIFCDTMLGQGNSEAKSCHHSPIILHVFCPRAFKMAQSSGEKKGGFFLQ